MKNEDKDAKGAEKVPSPHVGALLKAFMKRNRYFQSGLARVLGVDGNAPARWMKRASLGTDTLWAVSHALKHNFFADLAAALPEDFTTDAPVDGSKDARIRELEERLKIAEAERDVLLRRG